MEAKKEGTEVHINELNGQFYEVLKNLQFGNDVPESLKDKLRDGIKEQWLRDTGYKPKGD